jgi:hypothetical protein
MVWLRRFLLTALVLGCAGQLITWNSERFGVRGKARTKDLSFLPTPTAAKLMAFGQRNSVAKLRWIDSFAYFQLQLDRLDDRVAGNNPIGGFQRLYDTLIALDPKFEPFYQHAALCTGGVLGQHHLALGYVLQGTLEMPHSTDLWRHAAAIMFANFHFEEQRPEDFDRFLSHWADAETTDDGKMAVHVWKRSMARRLFSGLEQLPYWLDRLKSSKPGSPTANFIDATAREQLARYTCDVLAQLTAEYRRKTGEAPIAVAQVLRRDLVQALHLRLPSWFRMVKASDPYGLPYEFDGDSVHSCGLIRQQFEHVLVQYNAVIEAKARKTGQRPWTMAEALTVVPPPTVPANGELRYADGIFSVRYPPSLNRPWDLHQLEQ